MRFECTAILTVAPDSGDAVVICCLEVRIRAHAPSGSANFLALVDTGADNTILPEAVARDLGIPSRRCQGPAATAFGGQEIALSFAGVELALGHLDGRTRWLSKVYFVPDDASPETLIPGHQGFLDYFTAWFDGDECALELTPNRHLPVVTDR